MALKQLILGRKINERSNRLKELLEKRSALETREGELETALSEAEKPEDIEEVEKSADELEKEIADLDTEIKDLEDEKAELESELAAINEDDTAKKDEEERSKRSMKRKIVKTHEGAEKIEELRSGINSFVHSRGEKRDGFTSIEGGALIPEELLAAQITPEDVVDLRNYVKVIPVNSGSGKFPVITKSGSKMHTVSELAENPELAKPTIVEIDYSIETRRGYIPVSEEVIDDADYDVTGLIVDEIDDQGRSTANEDIAAVLKTAKTKAVVGVDGLKDLVNKEIKKVYDVKFYISSSLYSELDKLKDKNGRYLLQDSITTASGKVLLGKELVVLDDDVIGTTAGNLVGFVGDAKAHTAFFDRKKVSVQWVTNEIYGKLLAGVLRYDVKKTDAEAGYYVTYTAAPAEG